MGTVYAGFWRRLAAALIDGLIVTLVGGSMAAIVGAGLGLTLGDQGATDVDTIAALAAITSAVVQLIGNWLYFALLESSARQATPGKLALGLTVCDLAGAPLTFGRASGRFFGKIVSLLICGFGYLMAAFTQRQQTLHDLMAGCVVTRSAAPISEEEGPQLPYPDIGQAVVLLLTLLAVMVGLALPVGLLMVAIDEPGAVHPAALAVVNLISISLMVRWGLHRSGTSFATAFPLDAPRSSWLLPAAMAVVGGGVLLSELDNVLRTGLPAPDWFMEAMGSLAGGQQSLWGSVLALVIVAPLTEEILFRGLILRGFLQRYSPGKAMLVSSLLFGAFHLNPWQFGGATMVGLLFAWWYVRSGSLTLCILGHMLFNAVPLVVLSALDLAVPGFTSDPTAPVVFQPLWLDLAGVLLLVTGIGALRRQFLLKTEAEPGDEP